MGDQCKEIEKEKACTAKKNSEFSRCGSPCPDVCGEDPKSCIAECAEGCFCKEGYILSATGECISEDQCKQEQQGSCTAKKNSEWSICGSKCPAVCGKEPETCVEVCIEGCFCNKGYILSAPGECISEDQCQQSLCTAKNNSKWNICGSQCPAVCGEEPKSCAQVCVEGCFCMDGYISTGTGHCISEDQCKEIEKEKACTAKKNSEFSRCGSPCPDVCGEDPKSCIAECAEGCFCKEGYILSATGECISEDQCKQEQQGSCTAKKNSEWSICGSKCPAVCGKEPETCVEVCTEGCFCKKGYILSATGECISEDLCKQEERGNCTFVKKNFEWITCGSKCPAVCGKEP